MTRDEATRFALLVLKEVESARRREQGPVLAARQCLRRWLDQYAPDTYDEELLDRIAKDAIQFSAYIHTAWDGANKRRAFYGAAGQEATA